MKPTVPLGQRNVSITVSLPPKLVEKLDRIAAANGRTRSNQVARMLEAVKEQA